MPRRDYTGNAAPTTITAGINATDLSISIAAATGWPSGGASGKFYVTINRGQSNEERVLVQSRTGTTLTIASVADRGVDDTVAAIHAPNSSIEHTYSGVDADEANAHIFDTTRDDHTQYLTNARHDVEVRHQFGAALGTPSAPSSIGTANAAGTGDDPAREDHTHSIGAGAINSAGMFAADVVNQAAIAADAVGSSEIAADAVGSSELANNAVDTTAIADSAVTSAKIADSNITLAKMADNSVGTAEIVDSNVTNAKMADNAIGTAELIAASVTMAKLASEAGTAYVPTFNNVSLGTGGTKVGRYLKFGRLVIGFARFTLGTGGNVTGDISFTVPFTSANVTDVDGLAAARATLTAERATGIGVIEPNSNTAYSFTTIGVSIWGATSPGDWNDNDIFRCWFVYEAAA